MKIRRIRLLVAAVLIALFAVMAVAPAALAEDLVFEIYLREWDAAAEEWVPVEDVNPVSIVIAIYDVFSQPVENGVWTCDDEFEPGWYRATIPQASIASNWYK